MAKRRILRTALLMAFLAGLPLAAGAFFFKGRPGVPSQLSKDQIVQGDYITVGDTIDLEGNVDGDVIVAASHLKISGSVSGDVIAAASDLEITGEIEGDVRVAGVNVTITGTVGKNLNAWGSQVTLSPTAKIGRNAYVVADTFTAAGEVGRHLATRAARQTIGGSVAGDARLELGASGSAQLKPDFQAKGSVTYVAADPGQLQRAPAATTTGKVLYEALPQPSGAEQFRWYFFTRIVRLFGLLVVGLVLVSVVPRYALQLVQQFIRQPAWSLAWGLIAAAGTPVVVLALALTVIGLPLALMLAAAYLVALYLAQVIAGLTLGVWLFQRASSGRYRGSPVGPMVAGMALYVAAVSFFGPFSWVIKVITVLWGVGVIVRVKAQELRQWRS